MNKNVNRNDDGEGRSGQKEIFYVRVYTDFLKKTIDEPLNRHKLFTFVVVLNLRRGRINFQIRIRNLSIRIEPTKTKTINEHTLTTNETPWNEVKK